MAYAALIGGFFIAFYAEVRAAPPDTIVDATSLVVLLGLVSPAFGILVGRPWAIALPLAAFPVAAVMAVIGAVDDRYGDVARDRGGEVGAGWFGIATLVCFYAVPGIAIGVGLFGLGRRLEMRLNAKGGRSRPSQRTTRTRG